MTRPRVDREAERWLEAAEAFGTPMDERNERQRDIARDGLCLAYFAIVGGRFGVFDLLELSRAAFGCSGYRWPRDEEGARVRCLVACLFAAMTPAERREIGLPG